jgi:hypothetical protein
MNTRSTVAIIAAFAATFTLNLALVKAISEDVAYHKFSEVVTLNGRRFVDKVIFDLEKPRSRLDCARICSDTDGCQSFTLYDGVKCRGHSVALTTTSASVPYDGAQMFWASLFAVVFLLLFFD